MANSSINATICEHGLKPGDEMKTVTGETIPGSVVVNEYSILVQDKGDLGGYRLFHENALTGEQHQQWLSTGSIETLYAFLGRTLQ